MLVVLADDLNVQVQTIIHASVHYLSLGTQNLSCTSSEAKTTDIAGRREYAVAVLEQKK
jgi:hypothetical protein